MQPTLVLGYLPRYTLAKGEPCCVILYEYSHITSLKTSLILHRFIKNVASWIFLQIHSLATLTGTPVHLLIKHQNMKKCDLSDFDRGMVVRVR